jgi:hypothetical protein
MVKKSVQDLGLCVSHVALQLLFGAEHGLKPNKTTPLSGVLSKQLRDIRGALLLRYSGEQFGFHPKDAGTLFARREHDDTADAGLISEYSARGKKYKGQNESDHHVVLPGSPRIVPEQEPFHYSFPFLGISVILTCEGPLILRTYAKPLKLHIVDTFLPPVFRSG